MEIKIRNVSAEAVLKFDELAKKKGISRNEYLRRHLENLSIIDKLFENEAKYTLLIEKILKVLDYNTIALNKFCDENYYDLSETVEKGRMQNA